MANQTEDAGDAKQLQKQLLQKDVEIEQLKKSLKANSDAKSAVKELEDKIKQLGREAKLLKETAGPDRVVLDGKVYSIVYKANTKELALHGYRKHLVDENWTALVIEKFGD